mmetsp:Transcript_23893/g.71307  ORF Transcript_23893/g.71307 Transcript_23893/m.71307 type:complete len:392 (+) Transcript_23893:72-1247(+)
MDEEDLARRRRICSALLSRTDVAMLRDYGAVRVISVAVCGTSGVGKTAAIDAWLAICPYCGAEPTRDIMGAHGVQADRDGAAAAAGAPSESELDRIRRATRVANLNAPRSRGKMGGGQVKSQSERERSGWADPRRSSNVLSLTDLCRIAVHRHAVRYSVNVIPAPLVRYLNELRVTTCTTCLVDGIKQFAPTARHGRFVGRCLSAAERVGVIVVDSPGWTPEAVAADGMTVDLLGGCNGIVVVVDPMDPASCNAVGEIAAAAASARPHRKPTPAPLPFLSVCWSKTDILSVDGATTLLQGAARAAHEAICAVPEYAVGWPGNPMFAIEPATLPHSSAVPMLGRAIRPVAEFTYAAYKWPIQQSPTGATPRQPQSVHKKAHVCKFPSQCTIV